MHLSYYLPLVQEKKLKPISTKRIEKKVKLLSIYKDDVVNKLVITNTLKNSDENARKNTKSSISEQFSNINGVSANFEEKNNQLIMKLVIDYTKIDFDKAKYKLGMKDTLEEERKLSTSEKRAKDLGAEEKK